VIISEDRNRNRQEALQKSRDLVRSRFASVPKVAVILGSGLGGLADEIVDAVAINYHDLPGFATSTAGGHRGQLICGHLDGVPVVAMAGRFHRYEGYSDDEVTFPVQLLATLGAKCLVVSNAAGGLWATLNVGDIVVIHDHIDLARRASSAVMRRTSDGMEESPSGDRALVARTSDLYDAGLIKVALEAARKANFHAQLGVYLATLGPTYETRAEYRMMRLFNADVVGMSTAPEVRVAAGLGMRVLALSMVSNIARPDAPEPADHEEVLAAGRAAAFKLRAIVAGVLAELAVD
jgi:purine-nucleoside phosphorylase